jgi:ribose transport system permease protein
MTEPTNPTSLAGTPARTRRPAPRLGEAARSALSRAAHADVVGLVAVYVILFVFLSSATRHFFSFDNIENLLREMSVLGIVAVGQTMVILRGEIDLSVGSVLALSSVVAATAYGAGWPPVAVIAAAPVVGFGVGLVNGVLVAKGRVSSLVVTLGTMTVTFGIALLVTGGGPRSIRTGVLEILGQGRISFIPYQFIIMVAAVAIGALVLHFTVFGRSLYAAGDNVQAAILNGINVDRVTIGVFVISGLLASFGGLLLAGQFTTADPTIGTNFNLRSIAAVVIGGTSLFGGVGGVAGTAIGAALMATLANGLVHFNVQSAWQEVVTGTVIVAAVLIDQLRARRRG